MLQAMCEIMDDTDWDAYVMHNAELHGTGNAYNFTTCFISQTQKCADMQIQGWWLISFIHIHLSSILSILFN